MRSAAIIMAGTILFAAADEHQAVQLVAAGIDLDGVGDHLAAGQHAAHSHMALGKAVAEGDGVHLKGTPPASRTPSLTNWPDALRWMCRDASRYRY